MTGTFTISSRNSFLIRTRFFLYEVYQICPKKVDELIKAKEMKNGLEHNREYSIKNVTLPRKYIRLKELKGIM